MGIEPSPGPINPSGPFCQGSGVHILCARLRHGHTVSIFRSRKSMLTSLQVPSYFVRKSHCPYVPLQNQSMSLNLARISEQVSNPSQSSVCAGNTHPVAEFNIQVRLSSSPLANTCFVFLSLLAECRGSRVSCWAVFSPTSVSDLYVGSPYTGSKDLGFRPHLPEVGSPFCHLLLSFACADRRILRRQRWSSKRGHRWRWCRLRCVPGGAAPGFWAPVNPCFNISWNAAVPSLVFAAWGFGKLA